MKKIATTSMLFSEVKEKINNETEQWGIFEK